MSTRWRHIPGAALADTNSAAIGLPARSKRSATSKASSAPMLCPKNATWPPGVSAGLSMAHSRSARSGMLVYCDRSLPARLPGYLDRHAFGAAGERPGERHVEICRSAGVREDVEPPLASHGAHGSAVTRPRVRALRPPTTGRRHACRSGRPPRVPSGSTRKSAGRPRWVVPSFSPTPAQPGSSRCAIHRRPLRTAAASAARRVEEHHLGDAGGRDLGVPLGEALQMRTADRAACEAAELKVHASWTRHRHPRALQRDQSDRLDDRPGCQPGHRPRSGSGRACAARAESACRATACSDLRSSRRVWCGSMTAST